MVHRVKMYVSNQLTKISIGGYFYSMEGSLEKRTDTSVPFVDSLGISNGLQESLNRSKQSLYHPIENCQ